MDMRSSDDSQAPVNNVPRAIGRLGLWIAGSALIGSAALVLWNRRALKSLRDAAAHPENPGPIRDDDGIY
jgi:hypothetical protein